MPSLPPNSGKLPVATTRFVKTPQQPKVRVLSQKQIDRQKQKEAKQQSKEKTITRKIEYEHKLRNQKRSDYKNDKFCNEGLKVGWKAQRLRKRLQNDPNQYYGSIAPTKFEFLLAGMRGDYEQVKTKSKSLETQVKKDFPNSKNRSLCVAEHVVRKKVLAITGIPINKGRCVNIPVAFNTEKEKNENTINRDYSYKEWVESETLYEIVEKKTTDDHEELFERLEKNSSFISLHGPYYETIRRSYEVEIPRACQQVDLSRKNYNLPNNFIGTVRGFYLPATQFAQKSLLSAFTSKANYFTPDGHETARVDVYIDFMFIKNRQLCKIIKTFQKFSNNPNLTINSNNCLETETATMCIAARNALLQYENIEKENVAPKIPDKEKLEANIANEMEKVKKITLYNTIEQAFKELNNIGVLNTNTGGLKFSEFNLSNIPKSKKFRNRVSLASRNKAL